MRFELKLKRETMEKKHFTDPIPLPEESELLPIIPDDNHWNYPQRKPISDLFLEFILNQSDVEAAQMMGENPRLLEGVDPSFNTPLHIASQICGQKLIELMASGYNESLHMKNSTGDTPLHIAVRCGRNEVIEILMELSPSSVDVENMDRETPVSMAISPIYKIRNDVLWKMLKTSQAHSKLYDKGTLLHRLVYHKRDELFLRFISEAGTCLETVNREGDTVLHHAIRYRNDAPSIAVHIIERTEDVAKQNKDGATPLHMAVCMSNCTIVPKLLIKMTDANKKNEKGELALHMALLRPDLPHALHVLEKTNPVLCPDRRGFTPLHFILEKLGKDSFTCNSLCSHYHDLAVKVLQKVIANRELAEATKKGRCCSTLLNFALRCSNYLYAQMMLPETKQVESMDDEGKTAIHIALETLGKMRYREGFAVVCNGIFHKLENYRVRDLWGNTPLHISVRGNLEEYVEKILTRRKDTADMVNSQLQTPLHIAAYFGGKDVIWKAVVECVDDVNETDMFGCTALHYAVRNANSELVEALLQRGADVDAKDREGNTPLHVAIYNKNDELLSTMLDRTNNIDQLNKLGSGLLHLAIEKY